MSEETEFPDIEISPLDGTNVSVNSPRDLLLRAMLFAFSGSLLADVMYLLFFTIPFAIGWYLALFWCCAAWVAFGPGAFIKRWGAAALVCGAGLLPGIPVASAWFPHEVTLNKIAAELVCILAPSFVVVSIARWMTGRILVLKNPTLTQNGEIPLREKATLKDMFFLLTMACFAAYIVSLQYSLEQILNQKLVAGFVLVIFSMALVPILHFAFLAPGNRLGHAFRYLLLSCVGVLVILIVAAVIYGGVSGMAIFGPITLILIYFSAGGAVITWISWICDQRYTLGLERPLETL